MGGVGGGKAGLGCSLGRLALQNLSDPVTGFLASCTKAGLALWIGESAEYGVKGGALLNRCPPASDLGAGVLHAVHAKLGEA